MELLDYTQTKLKVKEVREDASEDRGEINHQKGEKASQLPLASAENVLLRGQVTEIPF